MAHILSSFSNRSCNHIYKRLYHKLAREKVPPLAKPQESPYIVGPYLKPKYLPTEYITEEIKPKDKNDFDHLLYRSEGTIEDESRKIKLLLIEDVEGLGVAGQVVEAPYRFGASKLIAMKKADYATDFALKFYKFGPKTIQSASSALSMRTARLLKSQVFSLPVKKNVQIKPWHLSLALRLSGCRCPEEAIEENSIDSYTDEASDELRVKCIVTINNHEKVEVRFSYQKERAGED